MSNVDPITAANHTQATTNASLSDFLVSLSGTVPDPYTAATSHTMNDSLQQFATLPALVLFAPMVITTAQDLGDLSNPPSLAKEYFGFQVLHQVIVSFGTYGRNAALLTGLIADMMAVLVEGELDPMKYCRLRHLGERHVLVVEAFINSLQVGEINEDFTEVTIMRKGIRAGVTLLEAMYLQALGHDFLGWMADMGMTLQ